MTTSSNIPSPDTTPTPPHLFCCSKLAQHWLTYGCDPYTRYRPKLSPIHQSLVDSIASNLIVGPIPADMDAENSNKVEYLSRTAKYVAFCFLVTPREYKSGFLVPCPRGDAGWMEARAGGRGRNARLDKNLIGKGGEAMVLDCPVHGGFWEIYVFKNGGREGKAAESRDFPEIAEWARRPCAKMDSVVE